MKILNLLKKEEKTVEKKKNIKHKKDVVVKNKKKAKTAKITKKAKPKARVKYNILKHPYISEKASFLSKRNQYVFKVSQDAQKQDIKNAVEDIYKVDVLSANVIKVPKKKRKSGKTSGWRKAYKKAIVKIKQGQKIDILPR
ncbi:MAG: 50S ribosomal protein L23 [Patescibacteria group bacterium]|nr:50S ribosomal protein L23 [Patescibacteria group bacterium]